MMGNRVHLDPAAEAVVMLDATPRFERVTRSEVELAAGDALIEVEFATVCASDLHTVAGRRSAPTPLVLGHEQVGHIIAFGTGPSPRYVDGAQAAIGDRVVWSVAASCGRCSRCARGMPQKCRDLRKYGHAQLEDGWELSGGFATHVHVRSGSSIVRVPEGMPAAVAAPASCSTATVAGVIAAAADLRSLRGELLVVSGCGMLGLTAIAMAREAGALVIGVDVDPERQALALRFGAHRAVDADPLAVAGALGAVSPGATGWGIALELSGSSIAIEGLLTLADVGAVFVLAGSVFPAEAVPVDAEAIVRGLITIRGVHNYRPTDLETAVAFLERADHEEFAALVGATVPFDLLEDALLARPRQGTRTGILPRRVASAPRL